MEWPTLGFFAGLFVMVGALVETGVIGQLSQAAVAATAGRPELTTMGLLGGSAVVSVLGIAARNGTPISFWQFTKYGLIVTVVTVALVAPYLWLRYLM